MSNVYEMWVQQQRADAAEKEIDRLRAEELELNVEIGRLRGERDEAREAARWLWKLSSPSTKSEGGKQWPWLKEVDRGI